MPTPVYVLAGQSNASALAGRNDGATVAEVYAGLTGSSNVSVATVAEDGAPLTWGRSTADWYNAGELPAQLIQTILGQMAQPDTMLAGILWVQGEGDSWDCARANEYTSRLIALVDLITSALAPLGVRAEEFRFTVLALSAHCPEGQDRANWQAIRAQQLALSDPRIDVIDPDLVAARAGVDPASLFQADGLHYSAAANDLLLAAMMDHAGIALTGSSADDRLTGLSGADTLRGGGGSDLLDGRAGDDTIGGWNGADTISGGAGDDRISSGSGRDEVWGGTGADVFAFVTAEAMAGRDRIMDFASGQDVIDLHLVDADLGRKGDQAFRWLGDAAADGMAGALWVTTKAGAFVLEGDMTGDGQADFSLWLKGLSQLGAGDLLL